MNFTTAFWFLGALLGGTAAIVGPSVVAAQQLATGSGGDIAAWVQAVGSIVAILAGFATLAIQTYLQRKATDEERKAIVEAACLLAFDALETVSERLENSLTGDGKLLSLQGDRTTEMVLAMREFDTSRLPATLLSDFIRLRSHVYAINEKISVVLDGEDASVHRHIRHMERRGEFVSTARTYLKAIELCRRLQASAETFGIPEQNLNTGQNLEEYINGLQASGELSI